MKGFFGRWQGPFRPGVVWNRAETHQALGNHCRSAPPPRRGFFKERMIQVNLRSENFRMRGRF